MASYGLVQVRWQRNRPSGQPAEDVAVNTIHTQVTDGGWTSDDRDTFDAAFTNMHAAVKSGISSDVALAELRYYNLPATPGPSGDPVFTTTLGTPGTGSAAAELPPQCAISITWVTAIRRRWGRIYLPGLVNGTCINGRVSDAYRGTLATAVHTFGLTLRQGGQGIVTWHRATWTPTDVTAARIDDVFDVIRRRRFGQKFHFSDVSFLS